MKNIPAPGWRAWLLAIFALTAGIRLLPILHVFDAGSIYMFDGDCHVHVRKVLLHIASYPGFVAFDPYEGYPTGTLAVWPPFMDWLWAGVCMVLGLGRPDEKLVGTVMALTPPIIGGLTSVAVAVLARRIMPYWAAILAGAALALMPAHITATVVGRPDNEMIEPLMTTLLYISYLRMQGFGNGIRWRDTLLAALSAFAMLLFWRGATLWMGLLAGAALADITADRRPGLRHIRAALIFGIVALAIALMAALNLWGRQNSISFNMLSWFHVILFALCAIALWAYGESARWRGRMGHMFYPVLIFSGAVLIALVLWLLPALRLNLAHGLGVVGIGPSGRDPWIDSIVQYWPMFYPGPFSVMTPVGEMGWAFWLMPLAAGHILWGMRRDGYQPDRALIALVIVCTFGLSIMRRRFVNVTAVGAAISAAYAVYVAHSHLKAKPSVRIAAVVLFFALLSYPMLPALYRLPLAHPGDSIKGAYEDAALWMRDHTPQASDPYRRGRPDYGVMAEWDMAGWIEYPAQRPVVATMYGTEAPGMIESARFFLATDQARADEIMERAGARYLVLSQDIADVHTYAGLVGGGVRANDFMTYGRVPETGEMTYNYGPRYNELIATRLLLADGVEEVISGVGFKAVHGYRLVYESAEPLPMKGFPRPLSAVKIFERVAGAQLSVTVAPDAKVIISAPVRTNIGREFEYRLQAKAGPDGIAHFTLPYAVTYDVSVGNRRTSVKPSDEDVLSGRGLSVDLGR